MADNEMRIFISWSLDHAKTVADALNQWVPLVIQAVDPWISTSIEKGARGLDEIGEALEACSVGIVCVTAENLTSPWLLFEAGALSKSRKKVWTFLLDLSHTDVPQPLGLFQHTTASRDDVYGLVVSINEEVGRSGGRSLSENQLKAQFAAHWPSLERTLNQVKGSNPRGKKHSLSEREILEEILATVRERSSPTNHASLLDLREVSLRGKTLAADAQPTEVAIYGDSERLFRIANIGTKLGAAARFLHGVDNAESVIFDLSGFSAGDREPFLTRLLESIPPVERNLVEIEIRTGSPGGKTRIRR